MNLSVTNSPFNEEQATQLNQIIQNLTPEQQTWLSGYLTANQQAVANGSAPTAQVAEYVLNNEPQANSDRHITVLYGSETGNAQSLGEIFADRLVEHNYTVKLSSMDDFKPKDLKKVEDLFVISSTHGEGDPPDNALSFHEFLHGRKAPKLEGVRFSVLALGDESYEFFCQTGKDFDQRLEELGGERIVDRQDCDIDYDDLAEKWMNTNIEKLNSTSGVQQQTVTSTETVASAKEKRYSKANPYRAEVLENINLNGRGSNKEVRHVELLLDNYGEEYEPGDCLVVIPENDSEIVTLLINTLKFDENEEIAINEDGEKLPLRKALTEHFEITKLTKPLLQKAADLIGNAQLSEQVQDADWVHTYIDGRDLVDLFTDFPSETFKAENLHQLLRKLPPREYSIASSYKANPDEVHITVGAVRYHTHGRDRSGVCSVQLAERVQPGDTIPIYLKKNPNFKFPYDEETPVIMIGPGTGVAPFRAYMQEREELGLESKTWLFFGEQHFTTDFLYQTEWQEWLKDDVLTKLDLAFSRDTDEKVYVQHRIAEHSATFYEWLINGAALYVCGDEKQMAKDVHQTIRYVLEQEGGMSETEAEAYLTEMKKEKRYQRDVY
ncbi:assimilatory sulfite reductase (NADPH) flavoprotein subunit [Staphylococcus gallinarum]|uniref:assimilatory sulfite reductase (NADPH) n=1 Tax=Staphylococcus gallinarum TaxID=1293 RepID=A0A3A0VKN7_STAGA|nr:assimilatory sulfite reductase (NADPH) flavoprotein subunit [Staphylococcus gallinarum]RIP34818.1 assimilatory sulfite reductase (NADPH) flavoprotein subunit [Staphylococcus gallinarum]